MLLGALLICLVWITLSFFLENERDSAERAAIQNSTNLAGAFARHLSDSFSEFDRSLTIIGALYAQRPENFDLLGSLKANRSLSDAISRVSIVDRDGIVLLEQRCKPARHKRERPRRTLKVQAEAHDQRAFCRKADLVGNGDRKMDCRTFSSDRECRWSFNGVVVASLDSAYLTRIYNSVNIGEHGYIRVIGLDGFVRATSGRHDSRSRARIFQAPICFTEFPSAREWLVLYRQRFERQYSTAYRLSESVKDYPLIITVGFAVPEIFSRVEALKKIRLSSSQDS